MLGVRRARDIRAKIKMRMELWDRCNQLGMVGDAEAEGAEREGIYARG